MELESHYATAVKAAIDAGKAILEVYHRAEFETQYKEDSSPLTEADLASNRVIMEYLDSMDIPVISEENKEFPYAERSGWNRLWMVDPLDGTKEFIKRNGEFTVNIALIHNQRPEFGVIYVPVSRELYIGLGLQKKSLKLQLDSEHRFSMEMLEQATELRPAPPNPDKIRVVGSRSHMNQETQDFIDELQSRYKEVEIVSKGSSLKFCLVAEGSADLYPRYAPTMEWDTAAGQAICEAVGLEVIDRATGSPLLYNRENLRNGHFLVH